MNQTTDSPNRDASDFDAGLDEHWVRNERDTDEHVTVPRDDRVLVDLGTGSATDRNADSRDVSNRVFRHDPDQRRGSW